MPEESTPKRVLIVEDDERLAELLQRHLTKAGMEVKTTGRGAMAISYVQSQEPHLVILDLRLPDISGYELCVMLRRLYDHARLPIIVLTGVEAVREELKQQAAGADAYLYKPYDAAELLQTIRRLLGLTEA